MGPYPHTRRKRPKWVPVWPQPGPLVTHPYDDQDAREAAAAAAFDDHFQPKAIRA